MLTSRNHVPCAQKFIRKLRGTSEPVLLQADDNLLYVVKFANNPQGPNTLFNESAGSELFHAFGLPTPPWKPLLIPDSFLDRNPGSWLGSDRAPVRPRAGLCFGSMYLSGHATRLLEILPWSWFSRITNRASFWWAWVIDACAHHLDRRQAVFTEGVPGQLTAYFIDHGHLFGGPNGSDRRPRIDFRYLDPRIYSEIDRKELEAFLRTIPSVAPEELRTRAHALPEEWRTAAALRNFDRCLDNLANPARLATIADEMISFASLRCQG